MQCLHHCDNIDYDKKAYNNLKGILRGVRGKRGIKYTRIRQFYKQTNTIEIFKQINPEELFKTSIFWPYGTKEKIGLLK